MQLFISLLLIGAVALPVPASARMFYDVMGTSGQTYPAYSNSSTEAPARARVVNRMLRYSINSFIETAKVQGGSEGKPMTGYAPAKYRTGGMCQYVRIGNLKLGSHGDALKCS